MGTKGVFRMTFEEIDNKLPNGFHDAKLYDLKIDYVGGTAVLRMALDFGNPDGPKRTDYRIGELRAAGLYFCSIDAPDPSYKYAPHGTPLNISGDVAKVDTFLGLEKLSGTLPVGVPCYRFFVNEWNSFINIAAKDVQIFWIEQDEGSIVGATPEFNHGKIQAP